MHKQKVLVAPLDWGLGHATRCIPVIRQLLQENCGVVLAGNEKIKALLGKEFPQLEFLHLKGYNIDYGRNRWELIGKVLLQIPKILTAIEEENEWLNGIIDEHHFDAVISDNRYGLHNERIYSVFMTHQLLIKTGAGNTADSILQKLNYDQVNQYNECWVPDVEGENNLAGELSHPQSKPTIPLHYIGTLSRFKKSNTNNEKHLLIILSGPEPQRSILEEIIVNELKEYSQPVILVRGLPESDEPLEVQENITVYNHLSATDLQTAIEEAYLVISRCGYSTVMDVMTMQKKSILIPTPGQTEQEYLARHLMQKGLAFCVEQSKLKFKNVMELASSFNYNFQSFENVEALKLTIKNLVQKLQNKTEAAAQ